MYDMPPEIEVEADGLIRIVRLNRPDDLNAVNHDLHEGLADLWPRISVDPDVRAVVLTGNGRAFCAGGDFAYLKEQTTDLDLRRITLATGKRLVLNMIQCRVPVIAAVNGPAVGLGCSLLALSDMVYMSEKAHIADPHVLVGLVAADGGPITWPLHTSLLIAKEFAFTGDRISAARAQQLGLANHVCAPEEVFDQALANAHRVAGLPQYAVETTKRVMNLHLERLCSPPSTSRSPASTVVRQRRPEGVPAPSGGLTRTDRRVRGHSSTRRGAWPRASRSRPISAGSVDADPKS
ncbi:MAG: enoyl-CoA hydratase/isomerase family protein [Acidimicrobiales bacterium]